jgi:hypothetical protein
VSETLHAPYQREDHAARIITADMARLAALICRRSVRAFGARRLRRSAFLKERGRVKVLVLVVSSVGADAGANGCGVVKLVGCRVPHQGSWI